jgi:hypothetical protein
MKISFCITCKGRLDHLKQTLLKNIEGNIPTNQGDPEVEFILLDYGCQEGSSAWAINDPDLAPYYESGTLKVAQAMLPKGAMFHMSHAKNMSHRLSRGDFVCNLDADNFLGEGFARFLADEFSMNPNAIIHPAREIMQGLDKEDCGFCGRIAMSRDNYIRLGGYDENRFPAKYGGEDIDFIRRARMSGMPRVKIQQTEFLATISHSNEMRVENMVVQGQLEVAVKSLEKDAKNYNLLRIFSERAEVLLNGVKSRTNGVIGCGEVVLFRGEEIRTAVITPVQKPRIDAQRSNTALLGMSFELFWERGRNKLGRMLGGQYQDSEISMGLEP